MKLYSRPGNDLTDRFPLMTSPHVGCSARGNLPRDALDLLLSHRAAVVVVGDTHDVGPFKSRSVVPPECVEARLPQIFPLSPR